MGAVADTAEYRAALAGGRSAVESIVARYHNQLVAYGRANGWPTQAVDDAVQVTWLQFFRHLSAAAEDPEKALRNPESLRFWLTKTTLNALRDDYRRQKRQERMAEAVSGETVALRTHVAEPDFLRGIELDERRSLVRAACERLGQTCRKLLSLLLIDPPLAHAEVAEIMERPIGSIGPTRQRCIATLQSLIAEAT